VKEEGGCKRPPPQDERPGECDSRSSKPLVGCAIREAFTKGQLAWLPLAQVLAESRLNTADPNLRRWLRLLQERVPSLSANDEPHASEGNAAAPRPRKGCESEVLLSKPLN
jgi:hypothetical protein